VDRILCCVDKGRITVLKSSLGRAFEENNHPVRRLDWEEPRTTMQSSSLPPAVRQRIVASSHPPRPGISPIAPASEASSGFATMTGSWTSTLGMSSAGGGLSRQPLAWAGIRHQVMDTVETEGSDIPGDRNAGEGSSLTIRTSELMFTTGHCSQAVFITCLHLSHEMALRDVGLYGWTLPVPKDPAGSMSRIMQRKCGCLNRSTR
jgi:regulator-associated protein of mTOR